QLNCLRIEFVQHDPCRGVVRVLLQGCCVFLVCIEIALDRMLYAIPSIVCTNNLRVDGTQFRGVAHDNVVSAKDHECPSTFGEVRNDNSELCRSNFVPNHRNELLCRIDVAAASMQ